jgi:hypothetical protein
MASDRPRRSSLGPHRPRWHSVCVDHISAHARANHIPTRVRGLVISCSAAFCGVRHARAICIGGFLPHARGPCLVLELRRCCCSSSAFTTPGTASPTMYLSTSVIQTLSEVEWMPESAFAVRPQQGFVPAACSRRRCDWSLLLLRTVRNRDARQSGFAA